MGIGRSYLGDLFGITACDWYCIYDRASQALHTAAQAQHFAIKRDHMVIVIIFYITGVKHLRGTSGKVKSIDGTFTIVDKVLAIGCPVRCLYRIGDCIDSLTLTGGNLQQFEVAA